MKLLEMKQIVNILYNEWNLGKKEAKAKGKICAWIYLFEILTDESCNFKFYEYCGCTKVYEKIIPNSEPDKCGNVNSEIGYIYEKVFD